MAERRTIPDRPQRMAPGRAQEPASRVRLAAFLFLIPAAGFGLTTPFTLRYLAREGGLPNIMGIRALSGPFEANLGPDAFMALGWTLVASCAFDALAGTWLWQGRRRGVLLGLGSTPISFALGIGFALPALLVLVPIRAGLLLVINRDSRVSARDLGL